MLSSTNQGFTFFQPVIAPVLALPLGPRLLIESRADLRGLYQQDNRTGPYNGSFTATLEYLQADYLVNRHVTITAGRFLTPFGTYNERLTAIWIRNLQDAPLSFAIGTRTSPQKKSSTEKPAVAPRSTWSLSAARPGNGRRRSTKIVPSRITPTTERHSTAE